MAIGNFENGDDVLVIVDVDTGEVIKKGESESEYDVSLDGQQIPECKGVVKSYHVASLVKIPCIHTAREAGYVLKIEGKKIDGQRRLKVTPYFGGQGRPMGGRIKIG